MRPKSKKVKVETSLSSNETLTGKYELAAPDERHLYQTHVCKSDEEFEAACAEADKESRAQAQASRDAITTLVDECKKLEKRNKKNPKLWD